jgi:TonB family protein
MAIATTGKVLRVALIQGNKITEDRPLKRRGPVTIGQDSRNTFIVPVSNLPTTFTLFEYVKEQYALVFTEAMDGKVKVGDADLSFQALREQGLAKKRGNLYVLPLNDTSKGRVAVGEVSILFQFVTPPPEPPKPELPPNIKGSFFSGLDQLFFIVLAASVFLHMTGATVLACQDLPPERELTLEDLVQDRFAKALIPVEIKKPEKKVEKGADKEEKKEDKKEDKKAGEKPPVAAPTKDEMKAKVASKGLLKILGTNSAGGGAFEDVLGASTGGADIANALSGASGVGVATSDAVAGNQKGGAAGNAATIGDLGTSGGGNVNLGNKGDAQIRGRVQDAAPEVESSDVDREALARYVKQRKAAITGCYEKELKRNPSLKGRVVVRFTIGTNGRVTEIDIEENTLGNDAVGSCIRSVIRGWVFPFKPESEATVAYPFIFSPAS